MTIDIYYKLKIIKLEGAHDKIRVEAAHKSCCVSCVLRCEERGKWGDHLLGILLGTHTGTGWVDKMYNVPVKVFMLNLIMLMKPGWSGEGDHKYWW